MLAVRQGSRLHIFKMRPLLLSSVKNQSRDLLDLAAETMVLDESSDELHSCLLRMNLSLRESHGWLFLNLPSCHSLSAHEAASSRVQRMMLTCKLPLVPSLTQHHSLPVSRPSGVSFL